MKGKPRRHAIAAWLKERFLLRLHMFWILTGTFLAGLLASRLLLALEVNHLAVRYVIAVFLAYLTFLLLIRLWLWYIGYAVRRERDPDPADALDLLSHLSIDGGAANLGDAADQGGGGEFGGGGATGSWGDAADIQPLVQPVSHASAQPSGCGFDIDLDAAVVVIAFIALVLTLFIAAGYVIYAAPAILADAAMEAALAIALARRAKRVDRPSWVGSVLGATFGPAIAVMLFAMILGLVVEHYCPDANRLLDALRCFRT